MTYEEAKKNITAYVYAECENMPMQVIKALNVAREALEKRIPKKAINRKLNSDIVDCPICKHAVIEDSCYYCSFCGQALDWSEQNG